MAARHVLALHARLPDRYAHLELLASTIDFRGRPPALLADPAQPVPPASTSPLSGPNYDATVVICDAGHITEIPLRRLDLRFTALDTLGTGVVLAAARIPRACPDERTGHGPVPADELNLTHNVRLFDASGEPTGSF
ncbi:hypothetical protein [Nocardia niigatensis]